MTVLSWLQTPACRLLAGALLLLGACAPEPPEPEPGMRLEPAAFTELAGWPGTSPSAALRAFVAGCGRIEKADPDARFGGKDFAGIELHQTQLQGGMSRMRPGKLEVPAGGSATLEPGGWHLMLFGIARGLAAGDTVPLTLTCGEDASEFPFTVKAPE